MPQTDPGTRSPGKLVLMYRNGIVEHLCGANLLVTADPSDTAVMRVQAGQFAGAVQAALTNISTIHGWRITDPDGITLYEEAFDPVFVGTQASQSGMFTAESCTLTATGRGSSNVVGNKRGATRTVVFTGVFWPAQWTNPTFTPGLNGFMDSLIVFLNSSNFLGADFYGQKAVYKQYVLVQLNAHYQKRYGI